MQSVGGGDDEGASDEGGWGREGELLAWNVAQGLVWSD